MSRINSVSSQYLMNRQPVNFKQDKPVSQPQSVEAESQREKNTKKIINITALGAFAILAGVIGLKIKNNKAAQNAEKKLSEAFETLKKRSL